MASVLLWPHQICVPGGMLLCCGVWGGGGGDQWDPPRGSPELSAQTRDVFNAMGMIMGWKNLSVLRFPQRGAVWGAVWGREKVFTVL